VTSRADNSYTVPSGPAVQHSRALPGSNADDPEFVASDDDSHSQYSNLKYRAKREPSQTLSVAGFASSTPHSEDMELEMEFATAR
jgi:hypothetical protein